MCEIEPFVDELERVIRDALCNGRFEPAIAHQTHAAWTERVAAALREAGLVNESGVRGGKAAAMQRILGPLGPSPNRPIRLLILDETMIAEMRTHWPTEPRDGDLGADA